MARPGPQTQAKRRREQEKKDKRKAKDEKKALKKALKKGEVDPVEPIAGAEVDSQVSSEPPG